MLKTDSIHCLAPPSEPKRGASSFRSGAHQPAAVVGHELLELAPGKALVGEHDAAVDRHPLEDLGGRPALGHIGRGELETDRQPVGRAEQEEPKAPEVARVRAAIAVAGVAGQRRAPGGLARLAAGHRGRVEQPQPVTEGGRVEHQRIDDREDLRRQRADALVVARLFDEHWEEMAQAPARERKELAVVGAVEEHLGDGQRDDLGVRELGPAARPRALREEIVHPDVKCGDEGVEVGAHEASLVDVAIATPDFGALDPSPRHAEALPSKREPGNSESTI